MNMQGYSVGAVVACVALGACSDESGGGLATPTSAEGTPAEATSTSADGTESPGASGAAEPAPSAQDDGAGAAADQPGAEGASGPSAAPSEGGVVPGGLDGVGARDGTQGGSDGSPPRPTYAPAATVENTGADCVVGVLPEPAGLSRLDTLPDPFVTLDGTPLTRTSEWRCRRQEILEQAEKYVYGEKPPKPLLVSGAVGPDQVAVDVTENGTSIRFTAQIVLPAEGTGPFPAIINLGAREGFGGITLGEEFILQQGVAIIFYNHYDLGQEGQPEASRGLPNPGLFYDIYGGDHSAGLLMAWAWGASRLLDVLQESGQSVIDPNRVGVTGCSRNGKGAFTVGVFDERIALTIPQETSTGGLPAYRIVDVLPGAERTNYNFFGLNWLGNVFEPFVENAPQLPIDSHEMVAMVAPRGLLVLDNPHIAQFAATAAHTAVLAGAEVYRALGFPDNVSYISDIVSDVHCASGKPEYTETLRQSIATFLKGEPGAPATMRPGASGTGDLAQWRTWQTPTLQADTTN